MELSGYKSRLVDVRETFVKTLLSGANIAAKDTLGVNDRLRYGPKTQLTYERVVDALATIRQNKVISYGESRYNVESRDYDMALVFSDIHRKYIRLKEQLYGKKQGTTESLADTLADLANYAIMGLEVLIYLEAKEGEEADGN